MPGKKKMRIVISGANNAAGAKIVAALAAQGAELLLIGDPENLRSAFPDIRVVESADLPSVAKGFDVFADFSILQGDPASGDDDIGDRIEGLRQARRLSARGGIGRTICFLRAEDVSHADEIVAGLSRPEPSMTADEEMLPVTQIVFLPTIAKRSMLEAFGPFVQIGTITRFLLEGEGAPYPGATAFVLSDGKAENGFYAVAKRLFDFMASLLFIIIFFWLLAIVWVVIRLDSPGPALFRQARVGRNGRVFTCYKFRTMFTSTPQAATHEVSEQAVTRAGTVLRRTKLDELPQLFNVLFNQMSLVGPRPCLPTQETLIAERQERAVLAIKPGITGLAQVNDIDMSDPKRLAEWDRHYLGLRSILFDLKILLETVFGRGTGDRVKRSDQRPDI